MPRHRQQLSVAKIKAVLAKPGRYSAGRNLELVIRASDAGEVNRRSWMFRYFDAGKGYQREMGLGPYPDISLEQARTFAEKLRMKMLEAKHLGQAFDPIDTKAAARKAAKAEKAKEMKFGDCADAYIETHRHKWRGKKQANQWQTSIDTYAAELRPLAVAAIDTPHLLKCLEPIWKTKTETATRLRQRIERVLDWATVRKYRSGENPARWRGHLQHLLPEPTKLKQVQHHPALPYKEIGDFMASLRAREGLGARALEFTILTAARSGEACGARWEEFDLEEKMWTVPAARMKANREHRVPLSDDAVNLLKELEKKRVDGFVFPGGRLGQCLTTASSMKQLKALRPGLAAHGFRSTFRDWAANRTGYQREVIEAALAHQLKDKTEAAYFRSDLFDKRTRLMQDWAKACRTKAPASGDKVVHIGQKRA